MKGLKYYNIANFNCTFGIEKEPMLNYFDSILYPAFKSEYKKKSSKKTYFMFKNIEIINTEFGYALKGCFVKKTELEIQSDLKNGELVETDEKYSTAPFSLFIIFLKNHRLVFMKNQKGSPNLKSFETHSKIVLNQYIIEKNSELTEIEVKKLLPEFNLNVVAFPSGKKLRDQLKEFDKFKRVELNLYSLNGEVEVDDMFASIRTEIDELGSSSGNLTINSPTKEEEIAIIIEKSKGTAKAKVIGVNKDKLPLILTDKEYKEENRIDLPEHNSDNQNTEILIQNSLLSNKNMVIVSKENNTIYEKFKSMMERLLS